MNNFESWNQICPERVFPVKNGKSEHHFWILDNAISLGTKFQFRLTILIFLDEICLKRVFLVKKRKTGLRY